MYAALWRILPGPRWWKVVEALALALLVLVLLMTVVFPAVEPLLPFDDITVGS